MRRFIHALADRLKGRIAIGVILVVIGQVVSAAHPCGPVRIVFVPINCLQQAFVECYLGFPPKLPLHFLALQCAGAIVTGPIFDMKQRFPTMHTAFVFMMGVAIKPSEVLLRA